MKFKIALSPRARETVESWDVRRLLNQVLCPNFGRIGSANLQEFGAMFFHPKPRAELDEQIRAFKASCAVPPLIVSDMENGPGDMVLGAARFPHMMGISQTGSEELAYETGKIAALEAGEIGYNWTFSPVADLAVEPDSPVVASRSAGHTPEHVIRMAGAYMRGLQENGMMATIKHFPGDGFTTWDQHLTTPVCPLGADQWRSGPGRAFRELIDQGAMAVMPGHIALPAFDEPDGRGLYPPATVSKRLLVDLLRGELGFEGLIVSDAIEMGGVVGFMNYYDACADTIENGCDMLLFPRVDDRFYREMEKRLASGRLTLEALKDRACRVLSLKEQLGLTAADGEPAGGRSLSPSAEPASGTEAAPGGGSASVRRSYGREIAVRVVQESITAVRDRAGLLPLRIERDTRVLHAVIMNNAERYADMLARVKDELGVYSDRVEQWIDPGPDRLFEAAADGAFDLIVCSIGSLLSYGLNVVRLHDEVARNMMGGWMKLGTPVVFVSHFHPFVHKEYEAAIDTIVNTYGDIEETAGLLVKALTGNGPLKRELLAHD